MAHAFLGIGLFIGVFIVVTGFPVAASLPLLPVAGAVVSGSPVRFVAYSLAIVLLLVSAYFGLWRRWKQEKQPH